MLGEADAYAAPAAATRAGFGHFVRDDGQGLHDVIDGPDGSDDRIRAEPDLRRQPAAQPAVLDRSGRTWWKSAGAIC